jgi:uncharacterized protein (TIGR02246 family)
MEEQKIRDFIADWARASEAGDLDTLLGMMAEDVVFLTAGNPPMSRADFASGFSNIVKNFRFTANPDIQQITVEGDLAVSWNRLAVEITPLAGGTAVARNGDVLTVFRRGTDGTWRIWRDANLMVAR